MAAHHGRKGSNLPALMSGLLVGLLGSLSDDLFGSTGFVGVLQVVLWAVSAVLLLGAVLGMLRQDPRPGGTAPA
jgi:lipopolysaccharide export LptBFGC system permease protein LptF